MATPKILKDPRFRAGTKLIKSGRDGAINVFALILEEARSKYGEASIETAPAYVEYGNALFREWQRQQEDQEELNDDDDDEGEGDVEMQGETSKTAAKNRNYDKLQGSGNKGGNEEEKSDPAQDEKGKEPEQSTADSKDKENSDPVEEEMEVAEEEEEEGAEEEEEAVEEEEEQEVEEEQQEEEEDDVHLALSMMETAFAIYDNYIQSAAQVSDASAVYLTWVKSEQIARVLQFIGDMLSSLDRHADAADAYTRELAYRDAVVGEYDAAKTKEGDNDDTASMRELVARRKAVEANVLIAQELLLCPDGEDVVTTEDTALLVTASERLEFATGYYQTAREQLQETVYLMGKLASRTPKEEFKLEKENICFTSTLLMGVGESIAECEANQKMEKEEPVKKKAKR